MLLEGAFTALLLVISAVSAKIVLPPSNVTVSCQNQNVKVSWDYGDQQPNTSFTVKIGDFEINTTDHQYDLNSYVWASEDRYLDIHFVTITAFQGGQKSEQVTSQTFTFYDLKPATLKCSLNFPPVTLKMDDSEARFRNPLLFYSELGLSRSAKFKFYVIGTNFTSECTVEKANCALDFSFPEGEEKCVTLEGSLFNEAETSYVNFKDTAPVCASETTPESELGALWILLIVLFSIILLVIMTATLSICVTKAWTMKTSSDPGPKSLEDWNQQNRGLKFYIKPEENISKVTLINNSPCRSSSVSSEEDDSLQRGHGGGSGLYPEIPGLYMTGGLSESSNQGLGTDDDSADDSVKTECVLLDLEGEEEGVEEGEEEVSPYEPRQQVHQVDMGDGEMVEAYCGR